MCKIVCFMDQIDEYHFLANVLHNFYPQLILFVDNRETSQESTFLFQPNLMFLIESKKIKFRIKKGHSCLENDLF